MPTPPFRDAFDSQIDGQTCEMVKWMAKLHVLAAGMLLLNLLLNLRRHPNTFSLVSRQASEPCRQLSVSVNLFGRLIIVSPHVP